MSSPGSAAAPTAAPSANANVLSEKVQRALQVRTDTPAMKAALDALAHLPANVAQSTAGESGKQGGSSSMGTTSGGGGVGGGGGGGSDDTFVVVDSRSVRVAIEQDALQQALLLQGELQKLVDTVAALRKGVTDTASIADRMFQGIQTDVTVTLTVGGGADNHHLLPPSAAEVTEPTTTTTNETDGTATTTTPAPSTTLEENQLARTLHDAFLARDQAQQRLTVVQAFLDKFDLSEEDSRLLDLYNFEDVGTIEMGESPVNGMAFLKALERVVHIRQALSESFGGAAALTSSSTMEGGEASQGLGASSALRMMESLAQKQEQAYERLYHWLQNYLHLYPSGGAGAGGEDTEDRLDEVLSHPFSQLALKTLQHVPAFYTHTLELIANARRSQATKQFLLALTSGYGGAPPLEMKAHDAVVYVGDMLAFCFRSFSVEADFAKTMRALQEQQQQQQSDDDDEHGEKQEGDESTKDELDIASNPSFQPPSISARETLALTMSGVARPLKSRILQVIGTLARSMDQDAGGDRDDDLESHDSMMDELEEEGSRARHKVTQLYEICGLLLFYASAMETVEQKLDAPPGDSSQRSLSAMPAADDETTPKDSTKEGEEPNALMKAVLDCLAEATSGYEATFRVYSAMLEQLALMSGDSEATLAHAIITGIADARVASPGFSQDVPCPKKFQTILSLDFALEVILEATLNTCKTLDDALMLQQAILKSQKTGLSDTAQELTKRVQEKEMALIDELVTQETSLVLDLCGLGNTATAWKNFKAASTEGGALNETMAAYPGLNPEDVQEAVKEFYTSLYSPPLPSLETTIKDPVTRKAARRQIAQRVCTLYAELYNGVMAEHATHGGEAGGYSDVSFLGHTPEQVVTLFSA